MIPGARSKVYKYQIVVSAANDIQVIHTLTGLSHVFVGKSEIQRFNHGLKTAMRVCEGIIPPAQIVDKYIDSLGLVFV